MEDVAVARVILVIDDDDNVRRSVRAVLSHAGWGVEQANDGEAGLRLIERRTEPYTLVITDLQMPQLDGRLVAETLGQCRPRQAVLCMSGSALECPPLGPHDTSFPSWPNLSPNRRCTRPSSARSSTPRSTGPRGGAGPGRQWAIWSPTPAGCAGVKDAFTEAPRRRRFPN
jgi:response regulator receiver domain-containing protein